MQNDHLRERLGERFCHVFHACKHDELLQFERLITETEIEWMLKKRLMVAPRGAHEFGNQ